MNNLTDEQIIKALEYYKEQGITSECEKCNIKEDCRRELIAIALDLINRKDAEIERLQEGIRFERERVDNIPTLLRQAESQTIKEYIEKASIKLADNARSDYWHWIEDTLHEVEREMVGD